MWLEAKKKKKWPMREVRERGGNFPSSISVECELRKIIMKYWK